MNDETISLTEVGAVIKRNLLGTLLLTALCVAGAYLTATYLPKRYKAVTVFEIPVSYFHNPLASDVLSESTDPAELSAQRQSLLKYSLDEQFINSLGEKYGIFKSPYGSDKRSVEREFFEKSLEYFPVNTTTFQLSITSRNPATAQGIARDVVDQLTYTAIETRYKKLIRAKDAITAQVKFLGRGMSPSGGPSIQSQHLQTELDKINASMEELRRKYTDSHPQLYKLRQRAEALRGRLKERHNRPTPKPNEPTDDFAQAFVLPNSDSPLEDIYKDLIRKLSYLTILLDMERESDEISYVRVIEPAKLPVTPVFPRKRDFAVGGLLLGLILSGIKAGHRELRRKMLLTPESAATILDVPLLGELPSIVEEAKHLLLTGPVQTRREALPAPTES